MANEREVKQGLKNSVCSVTGDSCQCESGAGCGERIAARLLEADKDAARLWTKAAATTLEGPIQALKEAINHLPHDRMFPAPEFRTALNRLERLQTELRFLVRQVK